MNVYWKIFLPTINTLVEVCGFAIVKKLIIMIKYFIIVYGSFSIIFNERVCCHNSDLENVHNNLFIHELFIQNYVSTFQNLPFGLYMIVCFTYYTYYTPPFTLYVGLLDLYLMFVSQPGCWKISWQSNAWSSWDSEREGILLLFFMPFLWKICSYNLFWFSAKVTSLFLLCRLVNIIG